MGAKYLIRLDDACSTFTISKWKRFFDLFHKYDIKPIIATIPNNRDPKLVKEKRSEADFWQMVKTWQISGWCVALHGFDHVYINNESGINRITPHSEFVGLTVEEQTKRIAEGIKIFENNGLKRPDVFVAPSHSLDLNTLEALKNNQILVVSDGLYTHPYLYKGLKWVPNQLWWPQEKKEGVWTICYHPETTTDEAFEQLKKFIERHKSEFIAIEDTQESSIGLIDRLYKIGFYIKRNKALLNILSKLRRLIKE